MLTEALAYPVLLLAVYGVSRAGARPNPKPVAWAWAITTALLVGATIAVHVRLALAGIIHTPFQVVVTSIALGTIFVAVAVHVHKAFGEPAAASVENTATAG